MAKYSLDIPRAEIGENGLSIVEGWVTVYNANSNTQEYTNVSNEYLMLGVGLPANGYIDAPILPNNDDEAIRRNANDTAWEIVADLRDKIAYSTETGYPEEIKSIGDLPDNLTLLAPQTVYDKWNGNKWVTDKTAQQAAYVAAAEEKKTQLLNEASVKINSLQYAIDTGLATNSDEEQILAWKTYHVLLSRIDTSKAPDIEWPVKPI